MIREIESGSLEPSEQQLSRIAFELRLDVSELKMGVPAEILDNLPTDPWVAIEVLADYWKAKDVTTTIPAPDA